MYSEVTRSELSLLTNTVIDIRELNDKGNDDNKNSIQATDILNDVK